MLHILRNPYGKTEHEVKEARLASADLIETYEKEAVRKSKNYLLFLVNVYEAMGGMDDFIDSFNTVEECKKRAKALEYDWFQIVDRNELKIINEGYCDTLT